MAKRKNITTTQLALMTAAAVISLRGLPMMAQEELTMFFYIFFATFLFLIPYRSKPTSVYKSVLLLKIIPQIG